MHRGTRIKALRPVALEFSNAPCGVSDRIGIYSGFGISVLSSFRACWVEPSAVYGGAFRMVGRLVALA